MAMLAEPRKKSKYRLQPFSGFSKINKRCDGDTNSVAFKLMASMGWAPGKGLGLNESGDVDPIKLRLKNDDAGLGYKVSEDDAIAQQSEFQALLLQLNGGSAEGDIQPSEEKKKSKKPKIKSLEKQSEQSTVRVHYKKFTRGKDLSRASEQDLRSILGLSSKKPKKEPEPEVEEAVLKVPEPVEENTANGLGSDCFTVAGSSVDYFKKKLGEKKKEKKDTPVKEENTVSFSLGEECNSDDKNKRRSVTWGDVDVSYVDKYIKDMVDTSGSVDESLIDSECVEEPPAKKKKKKNKPSLPEVIKGVEEILQSATEKKKKKKQSIVEVTATVEENTEVTTEKKKKKKRKFSEDESSKENVVQEQEDHTIPKKKKKRKVIAEDQADFSEANNCVDNLDTEALFIKEEFNSNEEQTEEPSQKKKKKKKKKNQVSALPEQTE